MDGEVTVECVSTGCSDQHIRGSLLTPPASSGSGSIPPGEALGANGAAEGFGVCVGEPVTAEMLCAPETSTTKVAAEVGAGLAGRVHVCCICSTTSSQAVRRECGTTMEGTAGLWRSYMPRRLGSFGSAGGSLGWRS